MSYDSLYTLKEREIRGKKRILAVPSYELMEKQRHYLPTIEKFPVHEAAYAYRHNLSTLDAVAPHFKHEHVYTLDLKEFFGSITSGMVYNLFRSRYLHKFSSNLTSLVTYKKRLPFGAPTSPAVSNAVFYPTDCAIENICNIVGLNYTRYSDDMIFSCDNRLAHGYIFSEIIPAIRRNGFEINPTKIKYNPTFILGVRIVYPSSAVVIV